MSNGCPKYGMVGWGGGPLHTLLDGVYIWGRCLAFGNHSNYTLFCWRSLVWLLNIDLFIKMIHFCQFGASTNLTKIHRWQKSPDYIIPMKALLMKSCLKYYHVKQAP